MPPKPSYFERVSGRMQATGHALRPMHPLLRRWEALSQPHSPGMENQERVNIPERPMQSAPPRLSVNAPAVRAESQAEKETAVTPLVRPAADIPPAVSPDTPLPDAGIHPERPRSAVEIGKERPSALSVSPAVLEISRSPQIVSALSARFESAAAESPQARPSEPAPVMPDAVRERPRPAPSAAVPVLSRPLPAVPAVSPIMPPASPLRTEPLRPLPIAAPPGPVPAKPAPPEPRRAAAVLIGTVEVHLTPAPLPAPVLPAAAKPALPASPLSRGYGRAHGLPQS